MGLGVGEDVDVVEVEGEGGGLVAGEEEGGGEGAVVDGEGGEGGDGDGVTEDEVNFSTVQTQAGKYQDTQCHAESKLDGLFM